MITGGIFFSNLSSGQQYLLKKKKPTPSTNIPLLSYRKSEQIFRCFRTESRNKKTAHNFKHLMHPQQLNITSKPFILQNSNF